MHAQGTATLPGVVVAGSTMSVASSVRRERPPILRTTWRAWASTCSAMRAMPLAFVATAVAEVLVTAAVHRLDPVAFLVKPTPDPAAAPGFGAMVLATLAGLPLVFLNCAIVAPLAVAMHRFVVLGERAPLLPLRLPSRALAYAAWATLFTLGYAIPGLIEALPVPHSALAGALATYAVLIATMRLTLLLPQIAVAAPGERLRTHWNALRWRFWNTTTILALAVMPVLALQSLAVLTLFGRLDMTTITAASDMAPMDAFAAPFVALGAAAMSWLFVAYAGRGDDPWAVLLPP